MKFVNLNIKFFLVLFLALISVAAFAVDPQEAVKTFTRTSGVNPGSVAVKITDLSNGKTIGAHNATKPLVPASIMKSVTTAALLRTCGPDYRYKTTVYTDGPLDMGILRGNLIVEGVCDPSLNSTVEPYGTDIVQEITETLKKMGVNKIEGMIIVDEEQFAGSPRPASWQAGDFSQSYGTGSHAFNFENNASGRRSVENPKGIFLSRLKSSLGKSGISVDGKDLGEGERKAVFVHLSPTIDEIMRSCMMRSDNLFAESMLRTYGKLNLGDGSTEDAASKEYSMWKKRQMPLDGVTIIDGSGLSRSNRVTADFMTAMLSSMADNEVYASFFPLAGQEGTLKSFLAETPLDSYIAMKTGSMKGIQCYAGYLLDDNYAPTHTVVIIMNDITGSRDRAKKAAQKMLLDIFTEPMPAGREENVEEPTEIVADEAETTEVDSEEVVEPVVEEVEVVVEDY
ncbi:MAG: D-alanyl-D-alanine carboxypeptidase [Muribaculaceae bacterium]|nr:D-alanyl-D-alanine carboxypeptidase [Muribaculaceae bacterium]